MKHAWWTVMGVALATAALLALSGCAGSAGQGAAGARAELSLSGAEAAGLVGEVEGELGPALEASRAMLLGLRDPNGPTCMTYRETGWTDAGYKPPPKGDLQGGPGNRILQIYYWEHQAAVKTPSEDFAWHQGTFRKELAAMRSRSQAASAALKPLLEKIEWLHRGLGEWPAWQAGLGDDNARPVRAVAQRRTATASPGSAGGLYGNGTAAVAPTAAATTWPDFCRAQLAEATARRDLAAARRWAGELRAALFALVDLHRWLELVIENQSAALDFQKLGESLFPAMDQEYAEKYPVMECVSRFPGGSLCITALNNYFEIERQAEGLFRRPEEYAAAAEKSASALAAAPAALWLTPDVRQAFAALRGRLSPALAQKWDQAAGLAYERSFLENHLFRTQRAGVLEGLGVSLERFAARQGDGTVDELMDVLVYRAGLGMSAFEWADRYDPRIVAAAGKLGGTGRREALVAAHRWAYGEVYRGSENYKGMVLSLRAALDTNKYDCIRGTDLIGALYRNAGWPGFLNVRWSRGESGHTIAAVATTGQDGRRRIVTLDSLFATDQAEGAWPESYTKRRGTLYSVELNGRGLDNYLMLEGYLLLGPSAGTRVRMAVPYLPGRGTAGVEKVSAAAGEAAK